MFTTTATLREDLGVFGSNLLRAGKAGEEIGVVKIADQLWQQTTGPLAGLVIPEKYLSFDLPK